MVMVIKSIISSHKVWGFHVAILHVDIQFKEIRDRKLLGDVTTNVVYRGEHVPEIEGFNRVLKERVRCYFTMLSYKTMLRMMVIHLVLTVTFYVYAFVWKRDVSQILPPVTILEGIALDYILLFQVIFGEYAHM